MILVKFFYKISLKSYDKILFQNKDDKSLFLSEGLIYKNEYIKIVRGSGVDIEKFKTDTYPNKITFSLAARMIKNKGILNFVKQQNNK